MEQQPSAERHVEAHDVSGHVVEIRTEEGETQLLIDGVHEPILVREGNYNLYRAAYLPPQKSLLDAIRRYFDRETRHARKDFLCLTPDERNHLADASNELPVVASISSIRPKATGSRSVNDATGLGSARMAPNSANRPP